MGGGEERDEGWPLSHPGVCGLLASRVRMEHGGLGQLERKSPRPRQRSARGSTRRGGSRRSLTGAPPALEALSSEARWPRIGWLGSLASPPRHSQRNPSSVQAGRCAQMHAAPPPRAVVRCVFFLGPRGSEAPGWVGEEATQARGGASHGRRKVSAPPAPANFGVGENRIGTDVLLRDDTSERIFIKLSIVCGVSMS